ncbi:MAG: hypothetical protein ACREDV_09840 [Methylocella sp.]
MATKLPLEMGRKLAQIEIIAEKRPKGPCDLNQWAKRMVDVTTGNAEES